MVNFSQGVGQTNTTLFIATFPCTITGVRWDISFLSTSAVDKALFWAIVIVKDGNTPGVMGSSTGVDLYAPEQNVMTHGTGFLVSDAADNGGMIYHNQSSTKTMRKLMGGDTLRIVTNVTAGTATVFGSVQYFCKA